MGRSTPLPFSLIRRADATGDDTGQTVVWVHGEHDLSTKLALVTVIARAADLDESDVLVDLSDVTFMDASIIGALIRSRKDLATRSLSLQVRAPSPMARRLLSLCQLDSLEAPLRTHAAAALETWVAVPAHPPALQPIPAAVALETAPKIRSPQPAMTARDHGGP